jgi:DNA-binding SARP family transcriptional activator
MRVSASKERCGGVEVALRFRCFGHFVFLDEGPRDATPAHQRGREFLQYLVTYHHAPVARDALAYAFWPDLETDAVGHRLHVAASGARATLRTATGGLDPIRFVDASYAWHPSIRLEVDADRFEACYADGSIAAMREAVDLYQGAFLAGEGGDWVAPMRVRYESAFITMVERLAAERMERHDYPAAIDIALRAIAVDRAHEGITRAAMTCFSRMGRRAPALAEYDALASYLHRVLGVEPMRATRELRDAIADGDGPLHAALVVTGAA